MRADYYSEFNSALLKECRDYLASFAEFPDLGKMGLAPTGERYHTLALGGTVEEAQPTPLLATSPEVAHRVYIQSLLDYLAKRALKDWARITMYWREYPNLARDDQGHYVVWSRLLFSDQPVLSTAELEARIREEFPLLENPEALTQSAK